MQSVYLQGLVHLTRKGGKTSPMLPLPHAWAVVEVHDQAVGVHARDVEVHAHSVCLSGAAPLSGFQSSAFLSSRLFLAKHAHPGGMLSVKIWPSSKAGKRRTQPVYTSHRKARHTGTPSKPPFWLVVQSTKAGR